MYKRLIKEWEEIKMNAPAGIYAEPDENNYFLWTASIVGPENSPFESGIFKFEI